MFSVATVCGPYVHSLCLLCYAPFTSSQNALKDYQWNLNRRT